MLKHLQEVIGLDMDDIPIYHSDTETLKFSVMLRLRMNGGYIS